MSKIHARIGGNLILMFQQGVWEAAGRLGILTVCHEGPFAPVLTHMILYSQCSNIKNVVLRTLNRLSSRLLRGWFRPESGLAHPPPAGPPRSRPRSFGMDNDDCKYRMRKGQIQVF